MNAKTPTEREIQIALYWHRRHKGDVLFAHNVRFYHDEADMISVTRAGLVHEFEIKRSRSDLWADLRKEKHADDWLSTGRRTRHKARGGRTIPLWRDAQIERRRPNYFWFVFPAGMVLNDDERFPAYAGVINVRQRQHYGDARINLTVIRRPKRLHNENITMEERVDLLRRVMYRYWTHVAPEREDRHE